MKEVDPERALEEFKKIIGPNSNAAVCEILEIVHKYPACRSIVEKLKAMLGIKSGGTKELEKIVNQTNPGDRPEPFIFLGEEKLRSF